MIKSHLLSRVQFDYTSPMQIDAVSGLGKSGITSTGWVLYPRDRKFEGRSSNEQLICETDKKPPTNEGSWTLSIWMKPRVFAEWSEIKIAIRLIRVQLPFNLLRWNDVARTSRIFSFQNCNIFTVYLSFTVY